jgi:cytoskeletal protein RodZ
VRCSRGHLNPNGIAFCATCRSPLDLGTPISSRPPTGPGTSTAEPLPTPGSGEPASLLAGQGLPADTRPVVDDDAPTVIRAPHRTPASATPANSTTVVPVAMLSGNFDPPFGKIGDEPSDGSSSHRSRELILSLALLIVLVVGGGIGYALLRHNQVTAVAARTTPTTVPPLHSAPTTLTVSTTVPPPTSTSIATSTTVAESALTELTTIAAQDQSAVERLAENYWIPLISSKEVGTIDPNDAEFPSDPYTIRMILENYRFWQARFPGALLLQSSAFSSQKPGYWEVVLDRPAASSAAVLAFCAMQGLNADDCDAEKLSNNLPPGNQVYVSNPVSPG